MNKVPANGFPDEGIPNPHAIFSLFGHGYRNKKGVAVMATKPTMGVDILDTYKYITTESWARKQTEELRQISDHDKNGEYKKLNFYFVTFGGVFRYRRASEIAIASPYTVFDFDEPEIRKAYPDWALADALADLRSKLIADEQVDTALLFTSPNGNGIKWVVYSGSKMGLKHRDFFEVMREYIMQKHGVEVDKSGSDISRACFLPYDPECYVNPEFLTNKHN